MILYKEALDIVLQHTKHFGVEQISFDNSIGRILQETLVADRDLPPYDRVTMDGIAINATNTPNQNKFKIEGIGAAGSPQQTLQDDKACLEIMTGAPLPNNADTIIRYEDVEIINGYAHVNAEVRIGQNIHRRGEDRLAGAELARPGVKISSAEIGVMAAIGKNRVAVSKLPRTVIISTGDELVSVNAIPLPHQIRKSNVYQLKAFFGQQGLFADLLHIDDDEKALNELLGDVIDKYDLVLLSGGVSKGKFDFVPKALCELGVEKKFHRVAQRPGKPFWFGTHPAGATVFALPGNPVSSFVCTIAYVMPWLRQSLGQTAVPQFTAQLTGPVHFPKPLEYFMEVSLQQDPQGRWLATPMKGRGSGDFANLLRGEAFMRFPAERNTLNEGESFPVYRYR